jgi:hypothetical protein
MTTTAKTWMTDQIPGRVARMDVDASGMVGDMQITSKSRTVVTKWSAK